MDIFILPNISLKNCNFKVEKNHHYFRISLYVLILSLYLLLVYASEINFQFISNSKLLSTNGICAAL